MNMKEYPELVEKVAAIFSQYLNIEAPSSDTDLLVTGMLDSLALVELLLRLEQTFGVRISVDDLELDDFRSLDSIARFVYLRCRVETPA
jgi:acyl carrier protein